MSLSDPSLNMAIPDYVRQGVADEERHEGFRQYAYPDPLSELARKYPARKYKWGYRPARMILAEIGEPASKGTPWTCGIGFTKGVTPDTQMTLEFARKRLATEVVEHAKGLDTIFPGWKTKPLFLQSVLVDMIYNMGAATLGTFKATLKLLKEGNYEQAAHNLEHTLWYTQVGNRAKENVWRLRNQMIQPEYIAKK